MRPLLPVLLASLFTVIPALAQEAAAPADPELAALEQEILDEAVKLSIFVDLNFNGKCDPNEKALILAVLKNYQVGVDCIVDPQHLVVFWLSPLQFMPLDERKRFYLDYQKRHPGPFKGKELRLAIEQEQALNAIAGLAGVAKKGAWRESLLARLAQEEDRNHNGVLDHDELVMRGALDQALTVLYGQSFGYDFDLNGDGVLSNAEREAVLEIINADLDLDGDGQVSLNDLQVLACLPADVRRISQYSPWPAIRLKAEFAILTKRFLPMYDRNGDGRWQPQEMVLAEKTESALSSFFLMVHPDNPRFTPAAREDFLRQILANRDLNGNGRVDYVEVNMIDDSSVPHPYFGPDPLDMLIGCQLPDAQPPLPPAVLKSLFSPPSRNSQNGMNSLGGRGGMNPPAVKEDQDLQPAAFMVRLSRDPRIPAETMADCLKTLLALHDSNHDGKLDAEEAWVGNAIEQFLERPIYPQKPRSFSLAERQAWIAQLVGCYDKDRDGHLNPLELQEGLAIESCWHTLVSLNETAKRLDKNGDGRLDAEERKSLELEILKEYDLNRNGFLEAKELMAFYLDKREKPYKKVRFAQPLTPAEAADWEKTWSRFDFNQTGNVELWRIRSSVLFKLDKVNNDLTYQDLQRWHEFMLKNFDSNQDGRIGKEEIQEYDQVSQAWQTLGSYKNPLQKASSFPDLQQWALKQGDVDGDGKLSLPELQRLNYYQKKLRRAHMIGESSGAIGGGPFVDLRISTANWMSKEALFKLYKIDFNHPTLPELHSIESLMALMTDLDPIFGPVFDLDKNGNLSEAEQLALAKHLLQIGDRNGNGRLDYGEGYQIMCQNYPQAQAATQAWKQEKSKRQQEQQRREQEKAKRQQEAAQMAKWLKKYDFNGNGKLDPEERARAEKDAKAGIQAPARDE